MSLRVDTCPHCGRHTESNEEFCTTCGAWLYGGTDWPAPPQPIPAPESGPRDPNAEMVPLTIPETTGPDRSAIGMRIGIVALAIVAAVAWFSAERMIVRRDDRVNWDIIWLVAAAITILAGCWLAYDAYRRGRSQGWDRAWRLWEPPEMS